jgi:hydroxypyruvate isomerase
MLNFSANLSLLFAEEELKYRFKAAKQQGFDAVEIQFPYTLQPETLRDLLVENDLKLVLFNVDADDLMHGGEGLASVPEKRQQFQLAVTQALVYAEYAKPNAINVLSGRCLDPQRLPEYLATFKDNLFYATDKFAQSDIKVVFEMINTDDMPRFIVHNSQMMLNIIDELKHPNLYLQCDIYHFDKMAENSGEFINLFADKIGHIQFADNPGRGQPGTGLIDFKQLFSIIENSAYQGWVGAEYKPVGTTLESLEWFRRIQTK